MILILAAAAAAATMQAQFDDATAAVEAGRCAEAVAGFDAITARGVRSPTVAAAISLRRGRCLLTLGRLDAAATSLTTGLAAIGDAPAYTTDRALALLARGQVAYRQFDYAAAVRDFTAARDLMLPADRFEPLLWLTRATMFDPGEVASGYADEALALLTTVKAKPEVVAYVRTLHARVLLNHGHIREAYAELRKALDEQGGLNMRVNADEIATRSDLAIAALLIHDDDSARKYLAYTGAGRGTPFGSAADMDPPPCDGVDLRPDDAAVVEFGIGADGTVVYATPVYSSRLGPTATAFAKAVSGWSWKPEALARISPLFRLFTRVELRCSAASTPPAVAGLLRRPMDDWLNAHGVTPFAGDGSAAAGLASARAELASRRAAGGDGVALIPVLAAIGANPVVSPDERLTALVEAQAVAGRNAAPAAVTTSLAIAVAAVAAIDERRGSFIARSAAERTALRSLLASPAVAADPLSRGVVTLLLAQPGFLAPAPTDAVALLRGVASDPALPEHDPLRSAAQIRLATIYAQGGDLDAARKSFAASGVSAQQCALVDAKPAPSHLAVSERDFPKEVLRWASRGGCGSSSTSLPMDRSPTNARS